MEKVDTMPWFNITRAVFNLQYMYSEKHLLTSVAFTGPESLDKLRLVNIAMLYDDVSLFLSCCKMSSEQGSSDGWVHIFLLGNQK